MPVANKILLVLLTVGILYTYFFFQNTPNPAANLTVKLQLDQALLNKIQEKYGPSARQRIVDWQNLIENAKTATEADKLQQVNEFFNQQIMFVDDRILWSQADYWATPVEILYRGAGDCEDFAIAKYFTLLEMGIADDKLRITYVNALELNQAHMVLTYFETPEAVPLVLDNLKLNISPALDRSDLDPVYSFNGSGLWLAKAKGSGRQVGTAGQVNAWADLKRRMLENPF